MTPLQENTKPNGKSRAVSGNGANNWKVENVTPQENTKLNEMIIDTLNKLDETNWNTEKAKEVLRDFITLAYNTGSSDTCEEIMDILKIDYLIKKLEEPSNWLSQAKGIDYKDVISEYNKLPFVVAETLKKIKSLSQSKENLIKEEKEI
jgi:hypothetical protein